MARYDLSEAEWRLITQLLATSRAGWRGSTSGRFSTAFYALRHRLAVARRIIAAAGRQRTK